VVSRRALGGAVVLVLALVTACSSSPPSDGAAPGSGATSGAASALAGGAGGASGAGAAAEGTTPSAGTTPSPGASGSPAAASGHGGTPSSGPSATASSAATRSGSPTAGASKRPGGAATGSTKPAGTSPAARARSGELTSVVYQLQNYPGGQLASLESAPHQVAIVDLSRYASADYFKPAEIAALKASGKTVLGYFEIGSIETFRPEYGPITQQAKDLILNQWDAWPSEYFVKYWDPRWWDRAIRPRLDQALAAGFDGVYLDTPLAYEELDLAMVPGQTRQTTGRSMVDLIVKLSAYAKGVRPGFLVFPQNSPELRQYSGYTAAIDGIGMEELFFQNSDVPCTQDYCATNLANTRALRDAGKLVLAVDYATKPANIAAACAHYKAEHFVGYVTTLALDRISPPCP